MRKKIAVISMSGGLDSTCLALKMLSEGYEVRAYAFDYGQRHRIELMKLIENVERMSNYGLNISLHVINLRGVFDESCSSLNDFTKDVPTVGYDEESMKSTVVENRNIIFSSIIYGKALSISKRENCNVVISLGIHNGDHALYPDTTKESRDAAEHCFRVSNWGSERISYVTPFVEISKWEVLAEGIRSMTSLGFDMETIEKVLAGTHSCYSPDEQGRSCGVCGTCVERLEAFKTLGMMEDPIEYV